LLKEVEGHSDPQPPDKRSIEEDKGSTAEKLAKQYNVSPKTIKRDATLAEAVNAICEVSPEVRQKILSGETKINKKELKELAVKPKEVIEATAQQIEEGTYEKKKPAARKSAIDRSKKPNIILINCDDLGYGDLGCYGSTRNKTPNIDRLAAYGTVFTNFYMAAPVCSASRAAMLTGCYPRRVGFPGVLFPGQAIGLNPDESCMARMFKHEDYATMIIGKWHCGDQPEFLPANHGFDHYFGIPYSNDMGRQQGREAPWRCPLPLMKDTEVIQQQPDLAGITERYTQRAVEFIRDNRDKPFFLYWAHMYVHLPHYAPDTFIKQSGNGDFGAVMACLDWSVGALIAELGRLGLENDTMILFTSDNGGRTTHGGSNGELRGAKASHGKAGSGFRALYTNPIIFLQV